MPIKRLLERDVVAGYLPPHGRVHSYREIGKNNIKSKLLALSIDRAAQCFGPPWGSTIARYRSFERESTAIVLQVDYALTISAQASEHNRKKR